MTVLEGRFNGGMEPVRRLRRNDHDYQTGHRLIASFSVESDRLDSGTLP